MSKEIDGVIIYYCYDQEDIIAEYDNTGTILRSCIHGSGIDEPIRLKDHDTSNKYYYLADGLGSITEIQDDTASTIEKYRYDSFGNVTILDNADNVLSESGINNSYMYTAREWDGSIGLYFYRARYYDAEVGRFISEDPLFEELLINNSINVTIFLDLYYNLLQPNRALDKVAVPISVVIDIYKNEINKKYLRYYYKFPPPYLYCDSNPLTFVDPFGLIKKIPGYTNIVKKLGVKTYCNMLYRKVRHAIDTNRDFRDCGLKPPYEITPEARNMLQWCFNKGHISGNW